MGAIHNLSICGILAGMDEQSTDKVTVEFVRKIPAMFASCSKDRYEKVTVVVMREEVPSEE